MSEPYYSDDHVTIYHGDTLDLLAELEIISVDAVVTDPPYASGSRLGRQSHQVGRCSAPAASPIAQSNWTR